MRSESKSRLARVALIGIVLICSGLPLLWLMTQLLTRPQVWHEVQWSSFRIDLLGRTLLYNACAAALAVGMGLPAAVVVGRGRGLLARMLIFLLPLAVLMPSVTYTYGWVQVLRLADVQYELAGPRDVARCIWTIASWLWALPAVVIGLALRRMDSQVQQQAMLDAALWRVTARQLIGPVMASFALVLILAVQEFAVYERSGISVIATEIRTVFETGSFGAGSTSIAGVISGTGKESPEQAERAAAAVATAIPVLIVLSVLTFVVLGMIRRIAGADSSDAGNWPRVLDARWPSLISTAMLLLISLGIPTIAMILSMSRPFDLSRITSALGPYVAGSLLIASLTGMFALLVAGLTSIRRIPVLLVLALMTFILGGELLAIANIRLYNRDAPWPISGLRVSGHDLLGWVYNSVPVMVIAYLGRFGWVALLAGEGTWSNSFRDLRDMAQVDGAGPVQTAWRVIWPIAWPTLVAGALLVLTLSLTEVGATVLLSPQQPQMLVPLLMGWVHMLRYDDMLEGSLLLMGLVFVLGIGCVMLTWAGIKFSSMLRRSTGAAVVPALMMMLMTGCGEPGQPEAVVGSTGTGKVEFVYPRAITSSRHDGTFFTIDRMARVQHLGPNFEYLGEWRMPDHVSGKPVGVSVGPDGNVYVPDTHYYRIVVYSPKGEKLREWGSMGKEPGQFTFPTDVAFDAQGNVYVSEYGDNDRIQVFDQQGKYLREFGQHGEGDGQFNRPQSLVIEGELVYVTDSCNHRIAVFKTDGTFVRNMGQVGSELGELRWPYGMDMDAQGRLVIAEFGNNRVQLMDKETGKGLAAWGMAGRAPGQLAYPWAVAVDSKDRTVVVDSGNNRLQVIRWEQ